MMVDIVMPIKEGRFIPQEVLKALLMQGFAFRLFVSTQFSNGNYPAARNNVKRYGHSRFVLMLDNDIVLPDGALSKMVLFLEEHPEYGSIGLPKQDFSHLSDEELLHARHVDMSCVLFRQEVLSQLTFHWPSPGDDTSMGSCECAQACNDIRKMGLEIGFLPGLSAKHIVRTEG